MSTLFNRNGRWVLEYREAGKLHRKSLGISADVDPKGILARQYQRDFDTRQAKQSVGIDDSPTPVSAAFDAHLRTLHQTSPRYLQNMTTRSARWCSWFKSRGIIYIEKVTSETVDAWIIERTEAGVSAKTIKDDIALLKSVARQVNRRKSANPIPVDSWPSVARVTAVKPETVGAYTPAEIEKILAFAEHPRRKHLRPALLLLTYLGCRLGELQALMVRDVDLRAQPPLIRIESHKTARTHREQHRYIEVHPRIVPTLEALTFGRRPDDPLVAVNRNGLFSLMNRACKKLGIQYRRLHGLRHYWISTMLSSGVPLAVVMAMCGHRNLSTTQNYLHLDRTHTGYVGCLPG